MPTSAPGSSASPRVPRARRPLRRGFTLVELLVVIAIIAVAVSLVSAALPDGEASRLEEEGARLATLLETARAEARVSGADVRWVPAGLDDGYTDAQGRAVHFRFVGLPRAMELPTRWLDERVSAQVVGSRALVLGPAAILPPQRVVLTLGDRRLELVSDGLGPFAVPAPEPDPPAR